MAAQRFPGNLALDETATRIHQVERGGFQFIGCEIVSGDNVAEFTYADLPAGLRLLPAAATAPANATIFWSGKMLDAGKKIDVRAYRAHAAAEASTANTPAVAALAALPAADPDLDAATSILSRTTVLNRAMSAVGSDTAYTMHDKINPKLAAEHWPDSGMRTDCSSFVAWCLRMSSKVTHPLYIKVNNGWFETRGVYADGLHETGFFTKVARARPGSLLVYPDNDEGKPGHMGIVVEADGDGVAGVRKVVHCSSGNFKATGRAIRATDAAAWLANPATIIVDYEGFV